MMPPEVVRPEAMEPIFVLGRQHSGNTMLATLLGNVPSVLGVTNEGSFFEVRRELDGLPSEERATQTARRIRKDGVRGRLPDIGDVEMWKDIEPVMKKAAAQGATATDLYALGMQHVLDRTGKERWAQKATSYIFLADDILEAFPRAQMIFIVRNPLDLAASVARRNGTFRHTARLILGWNRGVKYALRLQAEKPKNFMLIRYEDLVSDTEVSVRRICTFCDIPYDATYLDVPHVNKSETPYNRKSEQRGLNASRVYYYRDRLTPVEQAAVRLGVNGAAFNQLYPELAEPAYDRSVKERLRAVGLLASSAALLLAEEGKRLTVAPSQSLTRLARRFGKGPYRV